jgi:uncharacterized repeat protein (TIGR01451 family)
VQFTIVVTNTGNVTLSNVRVADALSPDCSKTSGAVSGLASMAAGASVTYSCSQQNVTASFTNTAVATGTPASGSDVSASDTAHVTVRTPAPPVVTKPKAPLSPPKVKVTHPAITITKSPSSQTVASGGTATFTIKVTNTGDVKLVNVTVADPRSTACNRQLGAMAPGASVTYTCTRSQVTVGFMNVATARGTAPTGKKVAASNSAGVKVAPLQPERVTPTVVPKKPVQKPNVISHIKPKTTG